MNALNIPRFTAEASVYASKTHYRSMAAGTQLGGARFVPAQNYYESSLDCGPCRLIPQNKFPWFAWRKSCVLYSRFPTAYSTLPSRFDIECDPSEEGAHPGEI